MIFVRPMAGLGNRMSVINSCILLARNNNNVPVKMYWDTNAELNAKFADLFKPIPGLDIVSSPRIFDYFEHYREENMHYKGVEIIKHFAFKILSRRYKYYNNEQIKPLAFNEDYWNKGHSKVMIKTYCDLYKKTESNNKYYLFRPADSIEARIKKVSSLFNAHTIGVHVRRKDNTISIRNSPDELFIQRMESLLREDDTTNFYFCSDDAATEEYFKSHFGNKLLLQENKTLDRNHPDGMADAVTDMFSLSRTKRILGSYYSSFSLIASNINKIPLEIITKPATC